MIQDLTWWDCYKDLDESLPENIMKSVCDDLTFVHPASGFQSESCKTISCLRFRISGNKSKTSIISLLNDKEALKGIKSGDFLKILVPDASVTRPVKKKSFIRIVFELFLFR